MCLGLYVAEAAGRPISKMFPLGALLMGVDSEVGGQRPGGGETRPAPAAWEQEQLCGTANNGRGCGVRRVPGLGVGACTAGAGNWEGVRLPLPQSVPGPSTEGRAVRGEGGVGLDSSPTMELCMLAAEGRGRRLLAHRPTFPCFAPSWPDAWVPGVGDGRELLAWVPPGSGGWGPALLETPRMPGGGGGRRRGTSGPRRDRC